MRLKRHVDLVGAVPVCQGGDREGDELREREDEPGAGQRRAGVQGNSAERAAGGDKEDISEQYFGFIHKRS